MKYSAYSPINFASDVVTFSYVVFLSALLLLYPLPLHYCYSYVEKYSLSSFILKQPYILRYGIWPIHLELRHCGQNGHDFILSLFKVDIIHKWKVQELVQDFFAPYVFAIMLGIKHEYWGSQRIAAYAQWDIKSK